MAKYDDAHVPRRRLPSQGPLLPTSGVAGLVKEDGRHLPSSLMSKTDARNNLLNPIFR